MSDEGLGVSLATSLAECCRRAGANADADDLCLMLGLPFLFAADAERGASERIGDVGQDIAVGVVANALEMTLRAVHPPEAAVGVWRAPEFAQHFEASYKPIVLRALENGQCAVALGMWSGVSEPAWAVVEGASARGFGLVGELEVACVDSMRASREVVLESPTIQVHVLERAGEVRLTGDSVINATMESVRLLMDQAVGERYGLTLAEGALQVWGEVLRADRAAAAGMFRARIRAAERAVNSLRSLAQRGLDQEAGTARELTAICTRFATLDADGCDIDSWEEGLRRVRSLLG